MPGPSIYLNHDFFNPDNQTEHSAYILGFITADGNLSKNGSNITLGLSIKDKCVLEYIRSQISNNVNFPLIRDKPAKQKSIGIVKNYGPSSYLIFSSKKLYNDLRLYGLCSAKTGKEVYPNILKPELKYHYLRGFFDGDGWISVQKRVRVNKLNYEPAFGLCCLNKTFLEELKNEIKLLESSTINFSKTCYRLVMNKYSAVVSLQHTMYNNASFYLQRKYDKFLEIPTDKIYYIYGEYKTAKEWSLDERCVVDYKTFLYRIKHNWDYELAMQIKSDKGSGASGESAHKSSLTDEQATTIKNRKLSGESTIKLAREYGVSTNAIRYCVNKRKNKVQRILNDD